jgi:hypothetical protein
MRWIGVSVLLAGLVSFPALAQFNPSPNIYQNSPRPGGGSQLNGYNLGTGRNWQNTYDSRGNSYGIDGRGRAWSYDRGSGMYYNYGSGAVRYGSGQSRRRY